MLKIENLLVSFQEKTVLNHLNINIQKGSVHGILGKNGAGKTTFFRALYGHIQPQKGDFYWEEAILHHSNVAFLETETRFYPYMKGKEYLELLASNRPPFDIEKWSKLFQLPLNRLIDEYSTGMRKKLAFIGVLALQRPILILDEPFNGVDLETYERMVQIIKRLQKTGKTILLSSHITHSLTDVCQTVSYLHKGEFIQHYQKENFAQLEDELRSWMAEAMQKDLDEVLPD